MSNDGLDTGTIIRCAFKFLPKFGGKTEESNRKSPCRNYSNFIKKEAGLTYQISLRSKALEMATGVGEGEDIVRSISRELIDEQPKIGAAVKNLIAMVLGRSISDPSTNLLFGEDLVFTPEIGLACGRCLLQAIQRFLTPSS